MSVIKYVLIFLQIDSITLSLNQFSIAPIGTIEISYGKLN